MKKGAKPKLPKPTKRAEHTTHGDYSVKQRLVQIAWIVAGSLFVLVGVGLILFVVSKPFRAEVDELYYKAYAAIYIDPPLEVLTTKQANIPYCGTTSRFQKLDVYMPRGADKNHPIPAVMYIHGGGWAVGDKASPLLSSYGVAIARRGMALVSTNYRLAPQSVYPSQNQDVACALNYLRNNSDDLGIDPNNIGLWGDSAGGQLAALTAMDPRYRSAVGAVVEFYGTSDLWAQITRKPTKDKRAITYIGSSTNQALADKASPLKADAAGAPPFLLFHGTNDKIVAYDQSVALQKKLFGAGVDATLRTVTNANHHFSEQSQPSSKVIKTEMAEFFKQKLVR
jgi:acetyl esterase/lipase